jgi:hypothetical protein
MDEKEEIEGRCPACHTPYDKDMIVKRAANCERSVTNFQILSFRSVSVRLVPFQRCFNVLVMFLDKFLVDP